MLTATLFRDGLPTDRPAFGIMKTSEEVCMQDAPSAMSFAAGPCLSRYQAEGRNAVSEPEVLMEGIVFGESPRWHDGQVWFSDWGANQVIAHTPGGGHEVVATVASFPMCIDFLPDGRLLVVDSAQRRLLRPEGDGVLVQHADLSGVSDKPWNDIVADDRGNVYVKRLRQQHRFQLPRR
jgi:sugar lactone lactonase YvrE